MSTKTALLGLAAGAAFALAYTQAPLYYSNQHQYFLHGLAQAGVGTLGEDWLANTADPTPAFSRAVATTVRDLDERLFYVYYALLQMAYLWGLWQAGRHVAGGRGVALFLALIFVVHAGALRSLSFHWLDVDYPWYFQTGLAGQYVLGPVLQPSAFGALVVASVGAFAADRRALAATLIGAACLMHSTYLLPGALLTIGYMTAWAARGMWRTALALGAWTLLLVTPAVAYTLVTFWPTSAGASEEARRILVHFRIPHHAIPGLWCDAIACVQIGWMALAVALSWRARLFWPLLVTTLIGAALTLLQVATASDMLALLFPWRVSAILVPAATAVIFARLCALLPDIGVWAAGAVIGLAAGAGVWVMAGGVAFFEPSVEEGMIDFVQESRVPGQVYLLPASEPNLKKVVYGAYKVDFKPPPPEQRQFNNAFVSLARFRTEANSPIYVDFKSIPYKDTEVIEWRRRLAENARCHKQLAQGDYSGALPKLKAWGVTHVVVRSRHRLQDGRLKEVFADDTYRIYRIDGRDLERDAD